MTEFGWPQIGELLGQLLALVVVVVLFLKHMERARGAERKQVESYIDELTEIGKECHTLSRESQKLYQDQLGEITRQFHEDTLRLTETLGSLGAEVKTLNRFNGERRK